MIADLFAGPGGWEVGALIADLDTDQIVGYEWDTAACETARKAGFAREQVDVSMAPVPPLDGLIASPPCQAYSTAGKGLGRLDRPRIETHVERIRDAGRWLHYSREGWHDDRSPLVLEPLRWALEARPAWIACEQVPAVLPLWQSIASTLQAAGYYTATGCLTAEQYGVPQTRKRAFLIARLDRPVKLPDPTHQAYSKRKPFDPESPLPKWISMAEALGWDDDGLVGFPRRADTPSNQAGRERITIGDTEYRKRDLHPTDTPAQVVTEKARSWQLFANARSNAASRLADEPAPTITAGHDSGDRVWVSFGNQPNSAVREGSEPAATIRFSERLNVIEKHAPDSILRISAAEASVLQSFPPDYPWQGSRTKKFEQIGNAVPPFLAAHVLAAVAR